MITSPTLGKLSAALSKAQGTMNNALKNKDNAFLKSTYSTLTAVWDACREHLCANELSIVQSPQIDGDNFILETMLIHSSGEYILSKTPMYPKDKSSQAQGSAITYARRYALSSIVGICPHEGSPEEDDGHYNSSKVDLRKESPEATKNRFFKTFEDVINLSKYFQLVKGDTEKLKTALANPVGFRDHMRKLEQSEVPPQNIQTSKVDPESKSKSAMSKTTLELMQAMKEGKI